MNRRTDSIMKKNKRTNNDLQITTQKTKDRTRGELRCSGMVNSSCSTCDTRRPTFEVRDKYKLIHHSFYLIQIPINHKYNTITTKSNYMYQQQLTHTLVTSISVILNTQYLMRVSTETRRAHYI